MMNYDDFKEYVKENILDALPDNFQEFEVSIRKTMKNNGLELDGLCIHGHDNIAPVIYLNGYYESYNDGASLEKIMNEISDVYKTSVEHRSIPGDIAQSLSDFEAVKENIFSRVVNTKNNHDLLEGRPHTEFEDLSVTYHILISKDSSGIASAPITNDMATTYGVTAEELDKIAKDNMARNNPMVFESMYNIMKDMFLPDMMSGGANREEAEEMFRDMFPPDDGKMYVLSNESKVNGAIWMTSTEALDQVAEKLGGDFFILPSSIHECIIVPDEGFDKKELQNMVMDVNSTQVRPEGRLSDNVYSYDSKEHKLSLATNDKTHEESHEHDLEKMETKKHSTMTH